jgi:hypothetical protein
MRSEGRYEVALDSGLELRDYKSFPPLDRMRSLATSVEPVTIEFEGRSITWHPGTDEYLPVVSILIASADDYREEREVVARFLSVLSFMFGSPIRIYSSGATSFRSETDAPFLEQPRLKGTIHPAPRSISLLDDAELRLCLV